MKKALSLLLSIFLVIIFVVPVSANNNTNSSKISSYEEFETATKRIVGNENLNSIKFNELSSIEKKGLKEKGIDTDKIGKLYYQKDGDYSLVKIVSVEDDHSLSITTLSDYAVNESGELERLNIPYSQNRISWYYDYMQKELNYNSISVYVKIQFNFYNVDPYYVVVYYQPYQQVIWYQNNSGTHNVSNLNVLTTFSGDLFYYNGSDFELEDDFYSWYAYRNVNSPTASSPYYATNYLSSNYCMIINGTNISGSVTVDNQVKNINSSFDGLY